MVCTVNKEVALKIEHAEIEMWKSRLTALQGMEGNAIGIEIRKFGHATALSAKNIPGPSFNTVKGLTAADEKYIEEIIYFYSRKGIPVQFELTPADVSSELFFKLNQLGFYQTGFHTSLYLSGHLLDVEDINNPCISVREMKGDEFDVFADIYTQGFQLPASLKEGIAKNNQVLYSNPDWTFYLALVDNVPAGTGVLFRGGRTAVLAAAATLPSQRDKGIHTMLIKKRLQQAGLDGCNFIAGQANFGSVSQNNMEKSGMRIGYTKAIWRSYSH